MKRITIDFHTDDDKIIAHVIGALDLLLPYVFDNVTIAHENVDVDREKWFQMHHACPICGSKEITNKFVRDGAVIPMVGCGSPWHYKSLLMGEIMRTTNMSEEEISNMIDRIRKE